LPSTQFIGSFLQAFINHLNEVSFLLITWCVVDLPYSCPCFRWWLWTIRRKWWAQYPYRTKQHIVHFFCMGV